MQGAHPACSVLRPLSVCASEQVCSLLPVCWKACTDHEVEMILLTNKGKNSLEVGIKGSVSIAVHKHSALR